MTLDIFSLLPFKGPGELPLEYFKSLKTLAPRIIFFLYFTKTRVCTWNVLETSRSWSHRMVISEVFDGCFGCPYLLLCFWLLAGRASVVPQSQGGRRQAAWGRRLHPSECSRLSVKACGGQPSWKPGFQFFSPLNINFSIWLEMTWTCQRASVCYSAGLYGEPMAWFVLPGFGRMKCVRDSTAWPFQENSPTSCEQNWFNGF